MLTKWDRAHMLVAETYAELSTAIRLKVGCVIVKDNRIISIGYNGMPSGWENSCEDAVRWPNGDTRFLTTKPEVLHAETNAIAKLAGSNESGAGATLYCTHAPCLDCAKLIFQSGIKRVFYKYNYRNNDGIIFLEKCNIKTMQFKDTYTYVDTDEIYCECGKLHEECDDNYAHMSHGY